MKNRISRKLRSRTGASILFALLLFLVCAVLASVALTAATASSGRMSEIAKSDQRYFAVTSAAELMKTLIDGKSVTITEVETKEKEEDVWTTKGNPKYAYSPEESDSDFNPILRDAAESKAELVEQTKSYTFAATVYSEELAVKLNAGFDDDGNITLVVEKDGYKLELYFVASMEESQVNDTFSSVDTSSGKVTDKMITTTTTVITWKLTSIKTGE